jgi:hypothetical protein
MNKLCLIKLLSLFLLINYTLSCSCIASRELADDFKNSAVVFSGKVTKVLTKHKDKEISFQVTKS